MKNVFTTLFIVLAIATTFMAGYIHGELHGDARTVNDATAMEWAEGHDRGCDEIERMSNGGLTCTVFLAPDAEEDNLKLYIIGEDAI